ncbi:MAG: hydroxyisourate hydrolase, partial [Verrucomicrobia bacterium]|nr:hydroxyisourate hydrolase [Verrucomicrobiota bacterium]
LEGKAFTAGSYELIISVADYFSSHSARLSCPPFLSDIPICFNIADASVSYHVPLLVSPWSYSTYRGS